ncbi:MAG TPA: NAD(P)/FAD-dependent oxidoreductase [Gaiellales bacterium]|nr:NAD(P)/FAD-dependent oxidoreductase [Gaiellales bacterium]
MTVAPQAPHRVVVVGGGFAGLRVAQRVAREGDRVQVTLIDRTNHHVFQPLLYQVATGILSPGQIAPALRTLFVRRPNVRVVLGEVTGIDVAGRVVTARDGVDVPFAYDTLVVAAGAGQSYFGHDEWHDAAPGLKTIEDAEHIRSRVLGAYEVAELLPPEADRSAWLTFVVVGAGPTGVELCGQFAFLAQHTLAGQFRRFQSRDARVVLLDAGPAVLPEFRPRLQQRAARELERMGVEIRLSTAATGIDRQGIDVRGPHGPDRIEARTVIWAAGVRASPLAAQLAEQTGTAADRAGRLAVGGDLTLPGHPELFAVGDLAAVPGVPGVAQAALQEGSYAAAVIRARLHGHRAPSPFRYRDKGSMAVVGRSWAVADIKGIPLAGRAAWMVWAVVHITFLVGWQNRLETVRRWLWDLISLNRHERLVSTDELTSELSGGSDRSVHE